MAPPKAIMREINLGSRAVLERKHGAVNLDRRTATCSRFFNRERQRSNVLRLSPMLNQPPRLSRRAIYLMAVYVTCMLSLLTPCAAEEAQPLVRKISYSRQVQPILSNNCFACHGPDEQERQADMRLDIPGEVDLEEVVARVTSTDPDMMMPPPDSHKELSPEQIEILQQWVAAGAPYQRHWAFVPPEEQAIPDIEKSTWSDQPIDRFVLARLDEEGLQPNAKTDKRTLIRRVTFDLTGLPPTLEEIQAFLDDTSEQAYENLVDRLLAKPQYGEHMARYWLDLVRFADTNGLHHDHYREMTPYRDWVIRAYNDNLPFDQFVVFQIAGDLFDEPTIDQQIASGFNRLHLIIDRGTALPEESFTRNVVDRVTAVGTAFLGLTVQCAVCHDHKYDPITQRDFYQLYAFFNNFDGEPETGFRNGTDFTRGLQPPYLNLPSPEQEQSLARLEGEIGKLQQRIKTLKKKPKPTAESPQVKQESAGEEANTELKTLTTQLDEKKKARDALWEKIPATLVMKERKEPRPAHILIRGEYDQPGEQVERNTPGFLPPLAGVGETKSRMDLANWLVDPSNPLTARVTVNRFWQQLFGVGLVKTSEDFGAQGEVPSHPELLDFLALEFVQSGWDVKSLMRSMVLSETYQQSSQAERDRYLQDPRNRLLARGSRFRLDAEVIRDQVLAVTGLLNSEMYGESVNTPQPEGLWKTVAMPSSYPREFHPAAGDQAYRRSVYTFWKRGLPPPQMTIFDAPSRESCIARRERTNTPLQALLLMNEENYFSDAMHYAKTLMQTAAPSNEARINRAYEAITSQVPDAATLSELSNAWQDFQSAYSKDPSAAQAMLSSSKDAEIRALDDPKQQAELAAWTMLVHSLLNLDATKTHE